MLRSALKSFPYKILLRGVVLLAVFGLGLFVGHRIEQTTILKLASAPRPRTNSQAQYPLISQLLACISGDKSLYSAYWDLNAKLNDAVKGATKKGQVSQLAIYFRDLESGQWTGVNETAKFYPASLLKVPIMMALFKTAETDPALLDKKILYRETSKDNEGQLNSSTSTKMEFGKYYTVNQLIEAMIVDSDNNAKDLLSEVVDSKVMIDLFDALDIPVPYTQISDTSYGISPRQYSLMFRILYNSTFLSSSMSEKALELLARTTFSKALTTGLPDGVKVAHKFGISDLPNVGKELHDCGIVYDDQHPYAVCIMTKGDNYDTMAAAIGEVSSVIYKYVQAGGTKS